MSEIPPRLLSVSRLLELPEVQAFFPRLSRPLALREIRAVLEEARKGLGSGEYRLPSEEELLAALLERLEALGGRRLRPLFNGTGILLHTNLGRSPLDPGLWEGARAVNEGYSNLEFDLAAGERGGRGGLVCELAAELAGAEAALVANNNAAVLLLALSGLAAGREVLVSRGEQIQIGGGFRIPELLALSGARLVEVGTTNVTRLEDYLEAVGPETALVLSVHTSNFVIRGFSSRPRIAELAAALPPGLPLLQDQGSGCVEEGVPGETPLGRGIGEGAALLAFSCDKLLGGPQAGILAGRADLIRRLSSHPLYRALRPGKLVLSLLEETLIRRLNDRSGASSPPSERRLEEFGKKLLRRLPRGRFRLVPSQGMRGGGSSPDEAFPSRALELLLPADSGSKALAFAAELRKGEPALVGLLHGGKFRIDLAALEREDPARVERTLRLALEGLGLDSGGG